MKVFIVMYRESVVNSSIDKVFSSQEYAENYINKQILIYGMARENFYVDEMEIIE